MNVMRVWVDGRTRAPTWQFRNKGLLGCFVAWSENAVHRAVMRRAMNVALRALIRSFTRKGLNGWIEFTEVRQRNMELIKRAMGAMRNAVLQMGFTTWYVALYPDDPRSRDASFSRSRVASPVNAPAPGPAVALHADDDR